MPDSKQSNGTRSDYDAVIVGASLAGCATAIALGRAGASVALVEKQPDPAAFKRICSHFIQASAVPALERLGPARADHRGGWGALADARLDSLGLDRGAAPRAREAVNLRRELLDPLLRETAAATPGVELMLGRSGGPARARGRDRQRRRRP